MSYIEIEKSVRAKEWSMHDLHSHTHYEIYFLSKGERTFFLSNALYRVNAPTLIVIPPHVLHKTEGAAFERYNVNVSPEYLNPYQKETLSAQALKTIRLNTEEAKLLTSIFDKSIAAKQGERHASHVIHALFSYTVYLLQNLQQTAISPTTTAQKDIPPLILKVMDFLHENYTEPLTLQSIADSFFISKSTLIYNFKKHTNCSLVDFLLNIRFTKAKELLCNTKHNMEEIAELCGFSSANYFSMLFKKKEGLSPMQYRKNERAKR